VLCRAVLCCAVLCRAVCVVCLQHSAGSDPWCKFNDHMLQLFTSCLFLAGGFAAIVGSWTCRRSVEAAVQAGNVPAEKPISKQNQPASQPARQLNNLLCVCLLA